MKVIIVGGVAGGATAAARIRRLNEHAEITVFERSGYISYANCGLPYYTGLLLVKSGQLRTYILSDEGREITLYRLFDMDMCLLSASCIMRSIQFEVTIEAEKDTDLWIIPAEIYKGIMKESAPVANYTNELMATRFSDVMWLIEQIMWKSLDKRVASFLLEETSIEGTNELKITHETIANHLGSHREVITRMLRYFQGEGLVRLSRGKITILDSKGLETLQRS